MNRLDQPVGITLRYLLYAAGILTAALTLTFICFGIGMDMRMDKMQEEHAAAMRVYASAGESVPMYIVKEYAGKIGIYEAGAETPMQILDVYVFTLPEADQTALRTGIRAYSSDALRALIEDFTG